MTTIKVMTLNSEYTIEQDDAGVHRIVASTNPKYGNPKYSNTFIGRKCTAPVIGERVEVFSARGGHTSKVTEITK